MAKISGYGPFFKHFGSKWRLAKLYPEPNETIIEPFSGGASYFAWHVQHGWRGNVILNDLDPRIATLWSYLKRASRDDILSLPLLQDKPAGFDILSLGLEQGASELIARWQRMGRGGTMTISKWNGLGGFWNDNTRSRIANNVQLLDDICVTNLSYRQLPNLKQATYFIDPPYQNNPVRYFNGNVIDHDDLADWVRSLKGRVIVCEGSPANWLPFRDMGQFKGRMQTVVHTEMTWYRDENGNGDQ